MIGQIDIFTYIQEQKTENKDNSYMEYLAEHFRELSERWKVSHPNMLENLLDNKTVATFNKIFLFTLVHYFKGNMGIYYGARFDKKEHTIEIYRIGKECDKVICNGTIEELLSYL